MTLGVREMRSLVAFSVRSARFWLSSQFLGCRNPPKNKKGFLRFGGSFDVVLHRETHCLALNSSQVSR